MSSAILMSAITFVILTLIVSLSRPNETKTKPPDFQTISYGVKYKSFSGGYEVNFYRRGENGDETLLTQVIEETK